MTPPNSPDLQEDISFEEFVQQALLYPCSCDICSQDLPFERIELSQQNYQYYSELWEALFPPLEDYEPPPSSPTNQEMHAINGNIDAPNPEHERIKDIQHPDRVRKRHHNRIFDGIRTMYGELKGLRLKNGFLVGEDKVPGIASTEAEYQAQLKELEQLKSKHPDWKNSKHLLPPPHKHQIRKDRIITNKEQHVSNGNTSKPLDLPIRNKAPKWDWIPDNSNAPLTETVYDKIAKGENPAKIAQDLGPTNKEMHSYNGNQPKRQGIKKKKKAFMKKAKKAIKKIDRKIAKTRLNTSKTIAAAKQAAKVESREEKIARKYNNFLKNPTYPPPRLGSSGNNPTLLVHGYFRKSYNMSAPFAAVTNATCITAAISPTLFNQFVGPGDWVAPIVISFTQTADIRPVVVNATGDFSVNGFINEPALLRQVNGVPGVNHPNPVGRFVGGSITLECRCPMTTTAPPFLFGGTLPEYAMHSVNKEYIDKGMQLPEFTPNEIRNLPNTNDISGFTVSSVYIPNNPNALLFNPTTAANVDVNPQQIPSAIPYVGMVNCPTSAVVTVTVSSWFEVQQNVMTILGVLYNTADYGGFAIGPKVSSEDIFDHLKRFPATSNRVLGMGSKSDVASSGMASLVAQRLETTREKQPTVTDQITELKKEIQSLKLRVDVEEDEKYFEHEHTSSLDKETEPYKGLSKSTIDLAMSIKKSLTPGSVTNKTVLHTLP